MKSEKATKSETKLRADAPAFVPLKVIPCNVFPLQPQHEPQHQQQEPQCSRYSRKSVWRTEECPNSPRPILGTKNYFPRPILGRKENDHREEDEYIGKEFRSIYRRMLRMKISDDSKKKREPKSKN
ncbi:hypothetical protein Trydic_g21696 [Trypoxylus dichotomus]